VLYALTAVTNIVDIVSIWIDVNSTITVYHIGIVQVTVFACCDFIAQFILIYRCWIMWGYSIRVVIIPSFLAFTFLAIWIASGTAPLFIIQDQIFGPDWRNVLALTGLTLSMIMNALVTGLIVFRILQMFRQVQTSTGDGQMSEVTGGSKLQRVIFIVIESGMALLSIQLARLVVTIVNTDTARDTYSLIAGIHVILNGITPTIISVRVSMGLSFHDESSMVEATSIGSMCFAPDNPNLIPETASINILDDSERRDNDIEVQLSDESDIQMVDR